LEAEKNVARKQWNYAAESWDDRVENSRDSGKGVILPGILKLLPRKRRMKEKALDLCCGEGYYSRILKDRGYDVSGVDISDKLIDIARKKGPDIAYYCTDAAEMKVFSDDHFDLVVCAMGLIDTPDLDGTLMETERVLKRGRYFVLAITHPCFDKPMVGSWVRDSQGEKVGFSVDNYSVEKGMILHWKMEGLKYPFEIVKYHRTLSTF
jgi:ubiquinone/menaquinone biosynthesis C-methylase UbiE